HHADRGRAPSQAFNDPAADRVGNRPERIVSHSGNYSAFPIAMALNSLPGECRTMSPRTRSAMPAGLGGAAAVARQVAAHRRAACGPPTTGTAGGAPLLQHPGADGGGPPPRPPPPTPPTIPAPPLP